MATKKSTNGIAAPMTATGKQRERNKSTASKRALAATGSKKTSSGTRSKKTPVKATLPVEPKSVPKEPQLSHEAVSLRAYYIGERRHKLGWHGDAHSDWLEALSQLRAEALEKPLKRR